MSHYDDRPEDLKQDAKDFLASTYGEYITSILKEMSEGALNKAADVLFPYPERYAAKYSAIKEVLNLLYSPLDDDTPSHG